MNDLHKKLQTTTIDIRLSHTERAFLRATLRARMETCAPTVRGGIVRSPYRFFHMHRVVSYAALLLLVVVSVGGGTSFAAQGSLPGDVLYPVKISVNEQVQVALATSPLQKAQVNTSLAERRIEEAQQLAARGTLTATTTIEIQQNLTSHVAIAQTIAQNIATSDPAASTQISTQLASTLTVNDAVLTDIAQGSNSEATKQSTKLFSRMLRGDIRRTIPTTTDASTTAEGTQSPRSRQGKGSNKEALVVHQPTMLTGASVAGQASSTSATSGPDMSTAPSSTPAAPNIPPSVSIDVANQLGYEARGSLSDVSQQYATVKHLLDTATIAVVDARLASIQSQLAVGDAALQTGDTSGAYASYTQALSTSTRLQTLLKAVQRFSPGLLKRLFNTEDSANNVMSVATSTATSPDASVPNVSNEAASVKGWHGMKKHSER